MKVRIVSTRFGRVILDSNDVETKYQHDVVILADGSVQKRPKHLSKKKYGTSHIVSMEEIEYVLQVPTQRLMIGTGMFDRVTLSEEAKSLLEKNDVEVTMVPTNRMASEWNTLDKAAAIIHTTC